MLRAVRTALALSCFISAAAAQQSSTPALTTSDQRPLGATKAEQQAEILRNFEIIAFGAEYSGFRFDFVRKWYRPIRVGIVGPSTPEFEQAVSTVMYRLRGLTKHHIELRYSAGMKKAGALPPGFSLKKSGINLVIYYYPKSQLPKRMARNYAIRALRKNPKKKAQILAKAEDELRNLLKTGICIANFDFSPRNQPGSPRGIIDFALIGVPSDLPEKTAEICLLEEFSQILGLPNDTRANFPTLFRDRNHIYDLTKYDEMMIKALYDQRLKPGMAKKRALKIVREIIEKLDQ
jgi:hypothetical protein